MEWTTAPTPGPGGDGGLGWEPLSQGSLGLFPSEPGAFEKCEKQNWLHLRLRTFLLLQYSWEGKEIKSLWSNLRTAREEQPELWKEERKSTGGYNSFFLHLSFKEKEIKGLRFNKATPPKNKNCLGWGWALGCPFFPVSHESTAPSGGLRHQLYSLHQHKPWSRL